MNQLTFIRDEVQDISLLPAVLVIAVIVICVVGVRKLLDK
jgi:hypothetical protein